MDEEEKRKQQSLLEAGLAGAEADAVRRYGAAVKEHFVAYSGVDNEIGQTLKKGLKQIAEEEVNPDYAKQNIKQQAGFAAEVKTVARKNAEKAIHGDTTRAVRTDDMPAQPDGTGHTIGGVNEPLYDLAEVDQNGVYIQGTGLQLKFVGSNPHDCCDRLLGSSFDKYREKGAPIGIPADYYDDVQAELSKRAGSIQKQIENAENKGNAELAARHRARLEKVQVTQKNLRKSELTNEDALFARTNPILSTGVDIAKVAHRSGMETAKTGAAIGGTVSIVKNLVSVVSGEKEPEEAVLDVAFETGGAAVLSYGTGFAGSAIKGAMQNASKESVRVLSKTNLPAIAVTVTVDAAKTLGRYFGGEIDGVECLQELGEQGTGMVTSAMFATLGQIAIPIPVVGAMIGSMLGYAISSASYGTLMNALKEEKLAAEERRRIEAECAEHIELIRTCRLQLEQVIQEYLLEQATVFQSAFDDIKTSMALGDIDGFIAGANSISQVFGREAQFATMEEFDALMGSDIPLKI